MRVIGPSVIFGGQSVVFRATGRFRDAVCETEKRHTHQSPIVERISLEAALAEFDEVTDLAFAGERGAEQEEQR